VRIEVLESLDGLAVVPIFSDVELFLATFPKDENIRRASIDVTTTTLIAVEQVIGFFISVSCMFSVLRQRMLEIQPITLHTETRASKAFFKGGDYQKALLGSLGMIQTKSKELLQEAFKSHMFQVEACMFSQAFIRFFTLFGIYCWCDGFDSQFLMRQGSSTRKLRSC
jgi:hypothetical protein